MGLDMYLTARKFLWAIKEEDMADQIGNPLIQDLLDVGLTQKPVSFTDGDFKLDYIIVQAGYWRKANHIHDWFVQNIQGGEDDCKDYYVDRDTLIELKETCEKVLLVPGMAGELLASSEGFFFGGTQIDDRYFHNLRHTVTIVETCMKYPENWDFHYRSSW